MSQILELNRFEELVRTAPLISVDFIILNEQNEVLLGYRNNNPAKGYYFIPGGRIRKDEKISDALARVSLKELEYSIPIEDLKPVGIFEQFYETNYFETQDISTHYISMPYQLKYYWNKPLIHDQQHEQFMFFSLSEAQVNPLVHPYTKQILKQIT